VTDQGRQIGSVRDRLLERYLGFAAAGLHFEERDISAEIAEARQRLVEFLGRELTLPNRPSPLIHLWVVVDGTGEIVGNAAREVGFRESALVVGHKRLRIAPPWRRRGFGSALLAENRRWYRECAVQYMVMEAEGDGSAFAATRGFDFDLLAYAKRPGFAGLRERELRFAAVDRLIRHPAIADTGDGDSGQLGESVGAFLVRIAARGPRCADQVRRFEQRLPYRVEPESSTLTGHELTFTAPGEIAAFGRDEPLDALDGVGLGSALLALSGWSGIAKCGG
jgi:GNAT superfamily N-acetyltransferase